MNVKTIVARSRVRKIPRKSNNDSDSSEEYTVGKVPRGGRRGRPVSKEKPEKIEEEAERDPNKPRRGRPKGSVNKT